MVNKDAYPLPRIEECLETLSGASYFCSLDLASGYHQIAMEEESKQKTAFSTRKGLFQYTVMPFGASNSAGTFQRLMEITLAGLQWSKLVLYLDDVLSFSPTVDEMQVNLEQIFKQFKAANLKLKPSKCKLFQTSVEFLGHVVSSEGVACDPKKIEAIEQWERPKNVKDVRSFVGFCQYYRKFIENFSSIAAPLYHLTRKHAKFEWTEICETTFCTLKEKLVTAPVLAYPTREDVFILDCDASLYGIGGVLSQIQDGEERPIAYGSKTLTTGQQNYCTTMRELLAVVVFVKQFHHYLWGRKFRIRTDHASLTWLTNFKEPVGMLARWISVLGNYDFVIEHRKGAAHQNADSLSRKVGQKCKRVDCDTCALEVKDCICVISSCHTEDRQVDQHFDEQFVESRLSEQAFMRHDYKSKSCIDLSLLSDCSSLSGQVFERHRSKSCVNLNLLSDFVFEDASLQASFIDSKSEFYDPEKVFSFDDSKSEFYDTENVFSSTDSKSEFSCSDSETEHSVSTNEEEVCVITRSQEKKLAESIPTNTDVTTQANSSTEQVQVSSSRIPLSPNWVESWSISEIRNMQKQDEVLAKVMNLKQKRNDPPDKVTLYNEDSEYKTLCSQWNNLEMHNGILYRKYIPEDPRDPEFSQIVVPKKLRKEILHLLHSHKTSGHLGITKTLGKLRQRFYWPGHKADVERWCKECKACEKVNISLNPKRAPLQPKPVYRRMDRVACDIMGPLPESEKGNLYILVVADYFSKYTEAYAIPDMTAQTVADKIVTEWICRYGCPTVIHSDQGRQFESELFQELCRLLDIHKTRTSRYRPNSDGVVERNNRTIKKMLRSVVTSNTKDWDDILPYVLMAYRATIHETTKCSANLLLFGSENRLPVDLIYADGLSREVTLPCPCEYVEWVRAASREAFSKARDNLKKNAERQKRLYDRNTFMRTFKIGDWVWVLYPPQLQVKSGKGWIGPFLVIKRLGEVNYVVQKSPDSRKITLHVDHIKAYIHKDTPVSWINAVNQNKKSD